MRPAPPLRSALFVPGNRSDWFISAWHCGTDALIVDLEDAVPLPDKSRARSLTRSYLQQPDLPGPVFVRINELAQRAVLEDLDAVMLPGLTGVMVPKVTGPVDITFTERLLGWFETERGMSPGSVLMLPLLENAAGLLQAHAIATASPRIAYMGGLGVRGGDLERSLGYRWSPEGMETYALRARALLELRAAGVPNPMSGLWTSVNDLAGLREFAQQNRNIGYEGMMAIHPSHVPVINEVFDITESELSYYRGLLETLDAAREQGSSAVVYEGEMVDTAMAQTARVRLAAATRRGRS